MVWPILFLTEQLLDARELLQHSPVFETVLLSGEDRRRRIAILVEVLCKTAFASGERYEVDRFSCLGIDVPVFLHAGVTRKTEALLDACALPRIVDEHRKASRIRSQLGLMFSHVV